MCRKEIDVCVCLCVCVSVCVCVCVFIIYFPGFRAAGNVHRSPSVHVDQAAGEHRPGEDSVSSTSAAQ